MELVLAVNALGIREDDAWCAIALEMSLRGYGETFDEALDELNRAVEAQILFAVQHDNVDHVFIPVEPHYFKLYADLKRETLKHRLLDREATGSPDYRVGDLLLPEPGRATFRPVVS